MKTEVDGLRLMYTLVNMFETGMRAYEEYEEKIKTESGKEVVTSMIGGALDELYAMYELPGDSPTDFLDLFLNSVERVMLENTPKKYRPVLKAIKRLPWPTAIDVLSSILKEYGIDEETGKERTTDEVIKKALAKYLLNNIMDKLSNG